MQKKCAILFLFLTLTGYGQNSTLLQNINYRAKELKHTLSNKGDSLILKSEREINKVTIFNNDFSKSYQVEKKETKIPLAEIPVGRFVTEVKIHNKLIIITLIRHNVLKQNPKKVVVTTHKKDEEKRDDFSAKVTKGEKGNKEVILPKNTKIFLEVQPIRQVKFYWIVNDINKGHSSSKILRIGDKSVVDRMIAQNKIDLKSKSGKLNTLVIWEVYDTSAFMRFKRKNPDYASAKDAECFNVIPFYKSKPLD